VPGTLSTAIVPPKRSDRETQTGAAVLSRRAAFPLLELQKDPALLLGRDAYPGIANREADPAGLLGRLDRHRHGPGWRELDGVTSKVEQNLAQARGTTENPPRQPIVDIGADLEILLVSAGRNQLDGFLDQGT